MKKFDMVDVNVVSAATSALYATYDSGSRFINLSNVSVGAAKSVNPPINVVKGDTLRFDTSDPSLLDTKICFYKDQSFTKEFVGSAKGLLSSAAMRAVSEVAEIALGAEGTTQLANKAFGVADNPYMEVLFDAMSLRTFTYNFKFAPKSEEETAEVQNIIRLLHPNQ